MCHWVYLLLIYIELIKLGHSNSYFCRFWDFSFVLGIFMRTCPFVHKNAKETSLALNASFQKGLMIQANCISCHMQKRLQCHFVTVRSLRKFPVFHTRNMVATLYQTESLSWVNRVLLILSYYHVFIGMLYSDRLLGEKIHIVPVE